MHVTLHELLVQVDVIEVVSDRIVHDVQVVEACDVVVAPEKLQKLELSERSLA